jgi:choline dehydrogenase-like flavoprotein
MSAFDFDVLIVGSGPAGVAAAFPLLEAGLRIGMVDGAAGRETGVSASPTDRVKESFGPDYSALLPQDDRSPKQRLYRSRHMTAAHAERTGLAARDFRASGAIARGGLSTVWGAYAAEFDDQDLRGYPFDAAALRASYDTVARRIGISGSHGDALDAFHGVDTPLQAAPPLHPAAALVLENARRAASAQSNPGPLTLGHARNALLTQAQGERAACTLCKGCLWPCAGGSIYASLHDLARLRGRPNFRLVDDFYVERIERSDDGAWAISKGGRIAARRILLAAGTLGTTRILLETLGLYGTPVRLLSNPLLALPLWLPRAAFQAVPGQGHTLAQLGLRMALDDGDYAAGALYSLDGLPLDFISAKLPMSLAGAARTSAWLAGSVMVATVYFSGRFSANTLRLEEGGLRIQGGASDALEAACAAASKRLRKELRALGAWQLPGAERAPMGLDNHYAGTCPMGGSGPLATDARGALATLPAVHVVDGAALPGLPAKHLTFSIMANADRIARGVGKALRA